MQATFSQQLQDDFSFDPRETAVDSLISQYERVVVNSIVTSFGLDFLLFHGADQHGGDVDTIHSVRQIGIDPEMTYKTAQSKSAYEAKVPYSKEVKAQYDSDPDFRQARMIQGAVGFDFYTRQNARPNQRMDLDHVISTKEIHEDRGRVLSGYSGLELANVSENLCLTDRTINRSMKDKTISEYLKWLNEKEATRRTRIHELERRESLSAKEESELYKLQQQEKIDHDAMLWIDSRARKSYEAKLRTAYYTSPQFVQDTVKAAGRVGIRMGARQVFGFIFMEIWVSVREKLDQARVQDHFDMEVVLNAIGNGVKQGALNAKSKYKELIQKYGEGMIAGTLASLTTTLCNIFFTTAKSAVQIIRQSWASLTEATSILLFNPDNLLFGERFRAAAKVLSAGASLVLGRTVQIAVAETLTKTPLVSIPVICEIIPTFCGVLLTGIMSCTLLYYLDHSKALNKAVQKLNELPTIERSIMEFKQQAAYFQQYAAELMQIDFGQFVAETAIFTQLAIKLAEPVTADDLNAVLKDSYEQLGITLPWQGDFNAFMQSEDHLVFE